MSIIKVDYGEITGGGNHLDTTSMEVVGCVYNQAMNFPITETKNVTYICAQFLTQQTVGNVIDASSMRYLYNIISFDSEENLTNLSSGTFDVTYSNGVLSIGNGGHSTQWNYMTLLMGV